MPPWMLPMRSLTRPVAVTFVDDGGWCHAAPLPRYIVCCAFRPVDLDERHEIAAAAGSGKLTPVHRNRLRGIRPGGHLSLLGDCEVLECVDIPAQLHRGDRAGGGNGHHGRCRCRGRCGRRRGGYPLNGRGRRRGRSAACSWASGPVRSSTRRHAIRLLQQPIRLRPGMPGDRP